MRHLKTSVTLFALFFVVFFLSTSTVAAKPVAGPVVLSGDILPGMKPVSGAVVNLQTSIPIELSLSVQNQPGLNTLLAEIYNPQSTEYHHYLAKGQFATMFGSSPAQQTQIKQFLTRNGLTFDNFANSNLLVHAHGSLAAIDQAFAVSMQTEQIKGTKFLANTVEPSVPAAIAPLVTGVQLEQAPQSLFVKPQGRTTGQRFLTPSGYGPADIKTAFSGTSYLGTGSGQKIGVVGFDVLAASDITAYERQYGVICGTCNVSITTVTTGNTATDVDIEQALDFEQIIALAPSATYYFYDEERNDFTGFQDNIATVASADVVNTASLSWGWDCEQAPGSTIKSSVNTSLATMSSQGQSFTDASGDDGSAQADVCGGGVPNVDYPGTEPNALTTGAVHVSATSPLAQTNWYDVSDPTPGFQCSSDPVCESGGGVSTYYAAPAWQTGTGVTEATYSQTGTYCGQSTGVHCREMPDVSGDGGTDGSLVGDLALYDSGTWGLVFGTSACAPQWAAFIADFNASSGTTIGTPMTSLYGFWNATQNVGYNGFTDVTTGSSDYYPVGTGYDMATGLGTPRLDQLLWDYEGFLGWDKFGNRNTISSGWNGTKNAQDGQAWAGDPVSNAAFSVPVAGGEGDIAPSANTNFNGQLGPSSSDDEQVVIEAQASSWTSTNLGAVARWSSNSNWYRAYINGTNLKIDKLVAGTATNLATFGFTASTSTKYWIKFKVVGTTLEAKVWVEGGSEPGSWQATVTDSSFSSGKEGIRFGVGNGVTANLFAFYGGSGLKFKPVA